MSRRISLPTLTRKKSSSSSIGSNSSGRSINTRKNLGELIQELKSFVKEGAISKSDAKEQLTEFKRYHPKSKKQSTLPKLTRKKSSSSSSIGSNSSGRSTNTRKKISKLIRKLQLFVKEGAISKSVAKEQLKEFKRQNLKTEKKLTKDSLTKIHLKSKKSEFQDLAKQGFTKDEIKRLYEKYKEEYLTKMQSGSSSLKLPPIGTTPFALEAKKIPESLQAEDNTHKIIELFSSVLFSKRHIEKIFDDTMTVLSQHGTGNAMCGVYALFNIIMQNKRLEVLITPNNLEKIVSDFQAGFTHFAGDASQIRSGGWFDAGEVNLVLKSLSEISQSSQLPSVHLTDLKSARQDLNTSGGEWQIEKSWNFFNSSDKQILGAVIIRSGHYYGLVYKNGVYYLLNSFQPHIEILVYTELEQRFPFFETQIMVICSDT